MTSDDKNRAIASIDSYVVRDVASGFRPEKDIIDSVVSLLSDEFSTEELEPLVRERTQYHLARHAEAEAAWPKVTDCDRLDQAFVELESRGIVCRQDFSCCGTCGASEIQDEMEAVRKKGQLVRGYAFYHMQDTESAVDGYGLCLNYGSAEEGELAAIRIGHEICDAIRAKVLVVEWDGSWEKRIAVKVDWKRRRSVRCTRTS